MTLVEHNYPNHNIVINNQNYQCKAGGILPYTIINNNIYFLLQKQYSKKNNSKDSLYSDFGGKREKSDPNIGYTAAREFSEETNGIFFNKSNNNNLDDKIKTSTIITESLLKHNIPEYIYNYNGKYLIYLLYVYPVNTEKFDNIEFFTKLKRTCEWINCKELLNDDFINTKLQYRLRKGLKKTINRLIQTKLF